MGNIPSSAYTIQPQVGNVTISTRSDPLQGFMVVKEVGLVFANSEGYRVVDQQAAKARLAEAMGLASAEAAKLGSNAILSMHLEIKEIGKLSAICSVYGTACIVAPIPATR